jgi:hypothetical protein
MDCQHPIDVLMGRIVALPRNELALQYAITTSNGIGLGDWLNFETITSS